MSPRIRTTLATAALGGFLALGSGASPAAAQQQIGFHPMHGPICSGPLGPGPCADVIRWMQANGMGNGGFGMPGPVGQGPGGGPGVPAGTNLPGAGLLPQDGQIVAAIGQRCGYEPRCMAVSWGAVEVQRCRNGFGVEGGCFGPNGEIMRVINRVVPQHLQPNVIVRNVENDVRHGPGRNNDLVGCNGAIPRLFGSRC
ncbi:hypothetical protein [Roseomonas chloroacetimidivorans]|uniref:hypothetical protein n=1 Tax=Roseomonas chloroacetimidivorans TaxID=1766656 RepID=UPI003C787D3F